MHCDCHIHMALDGMDHTQAIGRNRREADETLVRARLADYQKRGITFLRDGGDAWGVSLLAKRLAPEYNIRYVSPAFPIYKKGYYGAFIGCGYANRAEYMELLDEAEAQGADFIKLMLSGIMDFNCFGRLSCPSLAADELRSLIGLAHERGFAVMAHLNGDEAIRQAIEAGVDSVEHGNFMEKDTVKCLSDSAAVWVPTLSPIFRSIGRGRFDDDVLRRIAERQLNCVAMAASQGAYIAPGSDGGAWQVFHGPCAEAEQHYLQLALGSGTELVLGLGAAQICEKFRRRS